LLPKKLPQELAAAARIRRLSATTADEATTMLRNSEQPSQATTRRLSIKHITHYQYDRPIQRSSHRLHLRPLQNGLQHVLDYRLTIAPEVPAIEYEDVFGNRTTRFELTQPYTELTLTAESIVELLDVDPFAFADLPIRPAFPLVWMPWEQTMLQPYLQPEELPDTQLLELYDYAMSFVERNNRDLMETLFAINLTLFREYTYLPGSTNLETTPYQVFASKKGVCQDFANIFICLARLLGIPARYVCGYIYTGNNAESRTRSDQSHAWVQLYIPNIGWKAFDPTNGILPHTDHIRVAYGRHYRDTAPTAGTLYTGAIESMKVDVVVTDVTPKTSPVPAEPNKSAPQPSTPTAQVSTGSLAGALSTAAPAGAQLPAGAGGVCGPTSK
jgi:transglutaminase-like putative cysteine protease